MSLTAKRQAYVEARVAGKEPSAAYRIAYNAENMSPKAISVEAARLERNPSVALAIQELRAPITRSVQKTAEDIARFHWSVIENEDAPLADRLRASSLEMRRFAEYSDKTDSRVLNVHASLPEGTTLDELRALRDGLNASG